MQLGRKVARRLFGMLPLRNSGNGYCVCLFPLGTADFAAMGLQRLPAALQAQEATERQMEADPDEV